ncbi:acetyltransferase [Paraburkholderia saeva]|uniref:acetyltransferase n=1 Tax=Paraburkholderia saeva TaxID=2777537 RepID=UPI001DFED991|nr:acetyltransferase [Paraburkholderia saeva]CAG4906792.1 UDP-3-O-(3-hydroxymyristoyl)glucosamine N-acyltransferase [Paraburkholderia saeva]
MQKTKRLVILGDSAFAEIAYECFTRDSEYEVVAFAVESAHLMRDSLFGLPVVSFETLDQRFPPGEVSVYAALVYTQLNRLRTRLYQAAKTKGYALASYISSNATVWPNAKIGEHCFIFEGNNVQPFVEIGNNVVLWSGNHIGHHSAIHDNCFVSSHVVISGFCTIGEYSFLGVNASVGNNITIANDNWIGPGVVISRNTDGNSMFKASQPELSRVTARRFFKVPE